MTNAVPDTFIDNAKVMAKGQVTIPKDVRMILGIDSGSRVTFIVEKGSVRIVNSAVYAMELLKAKMKDAYKTLGFEDEEAVNRTVKSIREEGE